jgi:hypothetical protein
MCLSRLLPKSLDASKRNQRGAPRLHWFQASRALVLNLHFQVETHLFIRLVANSVAPHDRPQPGKK